MNPADNDIMGTNWVWYYSRNTIVINGKKYAVMEPVMELIRALSEERDSLLAELQGIERSRE